MKRQWPGSGLVGQTKRRGGEEKREQGSHCKATLELQRNPSGLPRRSIAAPERFRRHKGSPGRGHRSIRQAVTHGVTPVPVLPWGTASHPMVEHPRTVASNCVL